MNRVIQGSSADQMKMAMVLAHQAGIPLQMTVHDELNMSWSCPSEVEQLAEIMPTAVKCNVPHVVDKEVGPSWGELIEIETAANVPFSCAKRWAFLKAA